MFHHVAIETISLLFSLIRFDATKSLSLELQRCDRNNDNLNKDIVSEASVVDGLSSISGLKSGLLRAQNKLCRLLVTTSVYHL